jgi:hypothetical protein
VGNSTIGLGCLCCFHAYSYPLGEAACRFGADLHSQESAEHPSRLLERHRTRLVNEMILLAWGEGSRK